MANQYIVADRAQLYLLPPSMEDWLPEGHLAWFVIDVVSTIEKGALHGRNVQSGPGRPAYHPDQMLALLIYAYANGVRSSRQVQRLCASDLAYRVICAEQAPDHATIARFRADHQEAFKQVFVDVLRLCAAAGLASLGTVAIDGTKMGTDAATAANRTAEAIQAEVERILKEAEMTDTNEQTLFGASVGNQLPPKLARRSSRLAHLKAALAELEAQQAQAEAAAAQRVVAQQAVVKGNRPRGKRPTKDHDLELAHARIDVEVARRRAAEYAAAREAKRAGAAAQGRLVNGRKLELDSRRGRELPEAEARLEAAEAAVAEARRKARVNVSDPQSRLMPTRAGFIQGYNAQSAVNEHQIVLACPVTQSTVDTPQFLPVLAAAQRTAEAAGIGSTIGMVLADAGYWSPENATASGPDRLIATIKDYKQRRAAREMGLCTGPPPADASPLEAMEHRIRTVEGAAAYAMRSQTVEPVYGDIKANLGYRRFMRRGFAAAQSEWNLMCAIHNLLKLFRHPGRPRPSALIGATV